MEAPFRTRDEKQGGGEDEASDASDGQFLVSAESLICVMWVKSPVGEESLERITVTKAVPKLTAGAATED